MKNIEDAILKVRENPYKYLGKKSLKNLDLFISGYTSCQINLEGTYSNWLEDFSQFIQKKFNMFYSVRYSDIISFFLCQINMPLMNFIDYWTNFIRNSLRRFYELYERKVRSIKN